MKKIEAIIRPQLLEDVKAALAEIGVAGMTITEVRGCGTQKGFVDRFRVSEIYVNLLPKLEVKIVVPDDQVEAVVGTLMTTARTGEIGDGKIFVSSIDEAYRIRTGEQGEDAI